MAPLRIAAFLALAVGAIWIIQGFGMVPTGSFMDRQAVWGIIGLVVVAAAVAGLGWHRYRSSRRQP